MKYSRKQQEKTIFFTVSGNNFCFYDKQLKIPHLIISFLSSFQLDKRKSRKTLKNHVKQEKNNCFICFCQFLLSFLLIFEYIV